MKNIEYPCHENKKALLVCFILWLLFPFLLFFTKNNIKDFWARLMLFIFSPFMIYMGIKIFA